LVCNKKKESNHTTDEQRRIIENYLYEKNKALSELKVLKEK
jgi:hypothetical protein